MMINEKDRFTKIRISLSADHMSAPAITDKNFTLTDFELLLQGSVKVHGHICPGQVLGVKMSLVGLREIGIREPKGKDGKRVMVYVEMDRCATDAVQSVTGCSLGHRTLKFMDYGKMAATFVNIRTGKAVRVAAREEARQKAKEYLPHIKDEHTAQLEAYKMMPDFELFTWREVGLQIRPEDLPGRPLSRVRCDKCREYVQDMREIVRDGKTLCRPCAEGGYYREIATSALQSHSLPDLVSAKFKALI